MEAAIEIREAISSDVDIISSLAKITFHETFGHYFRDPQDLLEYFDRTFSVEKFTSSFAKENNVFWLALFDGVPVGYAKLKLNSNSEFVHQDPSAQLQKIYVLKNYLSKGVGKYLQNIMLDKARERGSKSIWLSVLNENTRAIRFYEKHLFSKVGEHGFDIGKESFQFHVMAKKL